MTSRSLLLMWMQFAANRILPPLCQRGGSPMDPPNRSLTFVAFASVSLLATFLYGTPVRAEVLATASCESLASLALPNAKVDQAQTVAPGAFVPPTAGATATGGRGAAAAGLHSSLAAFWPVTGTLTP